jgi:hypothetical protein
MSYVFDQGRSFTVIFERICHGWGAHTLFRMFGRIFDSASRANQLGNIVLLDDDIKVSAFGINDSLSIELSGVGGSPGIFRSILDQSKLPQEKSYLDSSSSEKSGGEYR